MPSKKRARIGAAKRGKDLKRAIQHAAENKPSHKAVKVPLRAKPLTRRRKRG